MGRGAAHLETPWQQACGGASRSGSVGPWCWCASPCTTHAESALSPTAMPTVLVSTLRWPQRVGPAARVNMSSGALLNWKAGQAPFLEVGVHVRVGERPSLRRRWQRVKRLLLLHSRGTCLRRAVRVSVNVGYGSVLHAHSLASVASAGPRPRTSPARVLRVPGHRGHKAAACHGSADTADRAAPCWNRLSAPHRRRPQPRSSTSPGASETLCGSRALGHTLRGARVRECGGAMHERRGLRQ